MKPSRKQGELFGENILNVNLKEPKHQLILSQDLLREWQKRIHSHQSKLFKRKILESEQGCLFSETEKNGIKQLNPLDLVPLPLSFWRGSQSPHHGPAIYLVMDFQKDIS